jgi:orotate phosphoribosyltransferase
MKEKYLKLLIEGNIFGFHAEGIKLKCGRISYYYANFRNALENPKIFLELVKLVAEYVKKINFDCLYGVPEGATPWAIGVSIELLKENYDLNCIAVGRGKEKSHGDPKNKYFICPPKGKVLILEDVTTTGSSLLSTIQKLKELDVEIVGAVTLLNRSEIDENNKTVMDYLNEIGIKLYEVSNIHEVLKYAITYLKPSKEVISKVYNYYREYCKPNLLDEFFNKLL